jgi:hypothetical protein
MTCWRVIGTVSSLVLALFTGCSDETHIHRTLRAVGAQPLREQTLQACQDYFDATRAQKVPADKVPPPAQAFTPLSLWAEPDGAYLLIDSDVVGERGLYLPRVLSDKDPICGPKLTHVKLAEGVYWYERKR